MPAVCLSVGFDAAAARGNLFNVFRHDVFRSGVSAWLLAAECVQRPACVATGGSRKPTKLFGTTLCLCNLTRIRGVHNAMVDRISFYVDIHLQ